MAVAAHQGVDIAGVGRPVSRRGSRGGGQGCARSTDRCNGVRWFGRRSWCSPSLGRMDRLTDYRRFATADRLPRRSRLAVNRPSARVAARVIEAGHESLDVHPAWDAARIGPQQSRNSVRTRRLRRLTSTVIPRLATCSAPAPSARTTASARLKPPPVLVSGQEYESVFEIISPKDQSLDDRGERGVQRRRQAGRGPGRRGEAAMRERQKAEDTGRR
jgi:hypothetical protein